MFIETAALALKVPESELRRLCNLGVLDVPRAGRTRLFPSDRIEDYRRAIRLHRDAMKTLREASKGFLSRRGVR